MAVPTTNLSTVAGHARRVFPQRAQATMLSLALVVSATLPAGGAVAQEADQEHEGVAAPEQTASPDSTADPDFDPGGETALPFDVGAPDSGGEEEDSGDGAPIDTEPVTDPEALAVPLDDPAAMAPDALDDGTDVPTPPAEPAPPAPLPPAPAPVQPPAATVPQQTNPDRQPTGDERDTARAKRGAARKRQRNRTGQRPAIQVTIPAPAETPRPAVPTPVAATAVAPVSSPPPPRERVGPGRATYTVQPGDSLWSIASRTLDTSATNAEIVAESNRIYQLNRVRIGPDPDLLAVGIVLRLR
jgi:LysM repeat protein